MDGYVDGWMGKQKHGKKKKRNFCRKRNQESQ